MKSVEGMDKIRIRYNRSDNWYFFCIFYLFNKLKLLKSQVKPTLLLEQETRIELEFLTMPSFCLPTYNHFGLPQSFLNSPLRCTTISQSQMLHSWHLLQLSLLALWLLFQFVISQIWVCLAILFLFFLSLDVIFIIFVFLAFIYRVFIFMLFISIISLYPSSLFQHAIYLVSLFLVFLFISAVCAVLQVHAIS